LAEVAIAACDAEVLGMAYHCLAFRLLKYDYGIGHFSLLFLINKGIRKMEAFTLVMGFYF
jgi:manganese transport protein